MTGSYFRGDAVAVLSPEDEARFVPVTYTYYQQLNGYEYLKTLDIAYSFYTGRYIDKINDLLDPTVKTIVHIPSVNSRESTKDKHREVEEIMDHLGTWRGTDEATGFHLIETAAGNMIKVADLVDDDPAKRDRVSSALKRPEARSDRNHVDIIIALGMAKEGFDWIWCEHALTVGYRSSLPEELTVVRMGKIVRDRYPELSETDQEAVRQHAIAALNITQQAAKVITETASDAGAGELKANTSFVDGVRKFMNVRELDIDLIDHINPFDAAVAILAKAINAGLLRQVQAAITARKTTLTEEEARAYALRAVQWKRERGRAPEATSQDPWERQLAEGVAAFARYRAQAAANG